MKLKYSYGYDALNRLVQAAYIKPDAAFPATHAYDESLEYDANGNITRLGRNGNLDSEIYSEIDDLDCHYSPQFPNRLMRVEDQSGSPKGFSDGANTDDDYAYDASGNLAEDKNKGITEIAYNHLNLPVKIVFGSESNRIEYLYAADGRKLKKLVPYQNPLLAGGYAFTAMDYLGGFHYQDGALRFFPTAEGYVQKTLSVYSYVYNYTDHLDNVRMSYAEDPENPGTLKVIEENHYYPFGLKHARYNSSQLEFAGRQGSVVLRAKAAPSNPAPVLGYDYKFNRKELQGELGLNWYDYGARNYDPALGRWLNIDPLAEMGRRHSPYNYAKNNPVYFLDPDGMLSRSFIDNLWKNSGSGSTTWTNNDDGTFSSSNGMTIPSDEESDTDPPSKSKPGSAALKAIGNTLLDVFEQVGIGPSGEIYKAITDNELIPRFKVNDDQMAEYYSAMVVLAIADPSPAGEASLLKSLKNVAKGGFSSFNAFKKAYGSAGEGMAWHHIVEQGGNNINKFGAAKIHNVKNIIKLPHGSGSIHAKVSGYYSSKQAFTGGQTVRQWLSSQSYQQQYNFGIKILKQFGYKP